MSKIKVLLAMLAVVALLLVPTAAFAGVAPPAVFIGTAYRDNEAVAWTKVTALIDGVGAGTAMTDADGAFYLQVFGVYPRDDGATVSFRVADIQAVETGSWEKGATTLLDLHAVTPPKEAVDPLQLTVSPEEGLIASLSGYGFTPLSLIAITWNGEEVPTVPREITADRMGRFVAVIVAPTIEPGRYTIGAVDGEGIEDEVTFTVPDLAGAPGEEGPPGDPGQAGERGAAGGQTTGIIAIVIAVIAVILVFVFKPKTA